MRAVARACAVVGWMFLWLGVWAMTAAGQAPTTTIQDTIYRADGTPAGGTVVVSWVGFTTVSGIAVAAGSTSATLGSGGSLSISLVANADSTPLGNYYTAIFHLDDGTTSRQYWVVPNVGPGGTTVKLAAIGNSVLPTTVAMQTVSKAYVDAAIARAVAGTTPAADSPYVLKTGDTMTGPLVLPGDPVSPLQAADKNYVDENLSAVAAGLGQKVSLLPTTTQVVSQPAGTQLEVNDLNGVMYATPYLNGGGNNGIQNALTSSNCATGCTVGVEPTYPGSDSANVALIPSGAAVEDLRSGAVGRTAVNPLQTASTESAAEALNETVTVPTPILRSERPTAIGVDGRNLVLNMEAAAGGSNQFPEQVESPPYFKSTYGALKMTGNYNTLGQHVQAVNEVNCYAVGDCLAGSQFLFSSGGYRDSADEGAHPFDLQVAEDSKVFTGTCTSGCATGSMQVVVTAATAPGTQGEGRFLIDTNPAKDIATGSIVGGSKTILGTVSFSGTSFPVSTLLETSQAALSQATNLAPGTVTLGIATTGVPSGFATSTSTLTASGVACVSDVTQGSLEIPNFEMAQYQVVDPAHVQLTLAKVHAAGAVLAFGGLCGYGLEQTADTISGLRQLFPVVGSTSPTTLYYADGLTPVVGLSTAGNPISTSAFLNYGAALTSLARSGSVVTATTSANLPVDLNGLTLTISGVGDASYNGSYAITTTGPNTFTYPSAGPDSTSSGGTATVSNGGFVLYPMAEVVGVTNTATNAIDGTLTLGPNLAPWGSGDTVEVPHYYQQLVDADTEFITQYVPKPLQYSSAGKQYQGTVGPGTKGWQITNAVPSTSYLGGGGTHLPPNDAHLVSGVWNNDFEADAGLNALIKAHCNLHGCNRWNSTYALFDLDSEGGEDFLYFAPQSHSFIWNLSGQFYSISPTSFTAPTINVGTLNAATLNGNLSASSITSGTLNAARLSGQRTWTCEPSVGDGNNTLAAATYLKTSCRNETGVPITITAIRCFADDGSSTSSCGVTNSTGASLVVSAITASASYATGTQSGITTLAAGDWLKVTFVSDGSSRQIGIDVAGKY